MWYRSGTQLVPFGAFMQGSSGICIKPRRPICRVSSGDWAHFGPRTIATRFPKNAGIRVARVTAGTRCYAAHRAAAPTRRLDDRRAGRPRDTPRIELLADLVLVPSMAQRVLAEPRARGRRRA